MYALGDVRTGPTATRRGVFDSRAIAMQECAQSARRSMHPDSCGLRRGPRGDALRAGACRSGCEEAYLRERAPRRDTGARGFIARGDSCGLRTRRCGQQRVQIGGMRGTCACVDGGLMTGGEPYDTVGVRETGAVEGRDSAANLGGVSNARRRAPSCYRTTRACVVLACTRRRIRTEMGNDTRRPLLAHPTYNSSELTRAGVRVAVDAGSGGVAVEAEWSLPRFVRAVGVVVRADGRALSNSSIGVAEWREKAACAGRGAWVRAEFGEGASLTMLA
ncbi:hypothetical protein C8R44DRAFT_863284 [Mycena epipterygia]|nr:hypothetical protein C8R44DRAFT_863284 [Mycena epipterygia]